MCILYLAHPLYINLVSIKFLGQSRSIENFIYFDIITDRKILKYVVYINNGSFIYFSLQKKKYT